MSNSHARQPARAFGDGDRVAARPWLWLPAPGIGAANTLAPYYCPATVTGRFHDRVEIAFDQPQTEVWPQRQLVAADELHPWPHRCRRCRPTAAPVDPAGETARLRRRIAELEAERADLAADIHVLTAARPTPA